jgi:hypothetical protein
MDDLSGKTIQELEAIAFADITDFVSFGGSTIRVKPISEVDPAKRPALREISQGQGKISVKLHDKVQAIKLLGEYLGLFSEINLAITCLRKYGIRLVCDNGRWVVEEEPEVTVPDQSQII